MKLPASLFLGLTLFVSPFLQADCSQKPSYHCENEGRKIVCKASNVDSYELAPEWNLFLKKGIYQTYGEEFSYHFTPDYWAILEMRVYCNLEDQPSDQSKVRSYSLEGWVRVCNNKAVFFKFIKGIKPPSCEDAANGRD